MKTGATSSGVPRPPQHTADGAAPLVTADALADGNAAQEPDGPQRRSNKLFTVCIFILVVEMCERLCYYTLGGSQRNFLESVGPLRDGKRMLQASGAVSISACFSMLSYLTCILGGYIADNRLGRYKTILYFALLYIVGVSLVAVSAVPSIMSSELGLPMYLVGALVFVAIGTGAIKPNVMNFGADQYDTSDEEELRQQKSFFSYFYLTINIGCVGAFGFCVNLATSDSTPTHAGVGYLEAYIIAAAGMTLAFLAFVSGTPRYKGRGGVTHTPMVSVIREHLVAAARNHFLAKLALFGWCLVPVYMAVVLTGSLLSMLPEISRAMTWVAMGLAVVSCFILILVHIHNRYIVALPARDVQNGGISVEEVKGALACVPTIVCINVGFNIPYNAMNNGYPAQACQMDTRIFGEQLNGAFFTLGDALAIILLVPCFEVLVFPFLTRRRQGRPVTRWAKYTTGFALAMIANLAAAFLEYLRRRQSTGADRQFVPCPSNLIGTKKCVACADYMPVGADCSGDEYYLLSKCSPNASIPMTSMSAFWTFIPMFLTGAGEILVNPVVYQYVFEQAPARLRSIVQALNLVAAGAISNAITASLGPLIPEDFNKGYLDYYFYANTAFAFMMLVAYWGVAACSPDPQPAAPLVAPSQVSQGAVAASFLATVDHGASVVATSEQNAASLLRASLAASRSEPTRSYSYERTDPTRSYERTNPARAG